MVIVGLNAFHADASACLFIDGEMKSAVEEERFTRIKHWAGFPLHSIRYCLSANRLSLSDVDFIAINTDPSAARFKKFGYALSGRASMSLIKEKLSLRGKRQSIQSLLDESDIPGEFAGSIEYVEHHLAHLAATFYVSPYSTASVISVDGFGDYASCAWGIGRKSELGSSIDISGRIYFPHSLGLFYQAMTQKLGFLNYGDEYKVMGLAPYGAPRYREKMDQILVPIAKGGFELNLDYFRHHQHAIAHEWEEGSPKVGQLFHQRLDALFDGEFASNKKGDGVLQQKDFDFAASVQDAYERAFFRQLRQMHSEQGCHHLAIAGGCGFNSAANGKVHLRTPYKMPYVQAAAGDAGGAVGAAIVAGQRHGLNCDSEMTHCYWGPRYSNQLIEDLLAQNQAKLAAQECEVLASVSNSELIEKVTDQLVKGRVVGWFQGAMEWGPRALGNRSILADPRRDDMQDILNLKIKRRESFRPFAPSVLAEHVCDWFEAEVGADIPFMMQVLPIRQHQQHRIPAVTHVDGSGRLQSVNKQTNPLFHRLISSFYAKTGVPMLLNTSFNENEPIVCSPQEALECFSRTRMDVLVLGNSLVIRYTDPAGGN